MTTAALAKKTGWSEKDAQRVLRIVENTPCRGFPMDDDERVLRSCKNVAIELGIKRSRR